jgi:two-component system chemotaxis response regulator CheY
MLDIPENGKPMRILVAEDEEMTAAALRGRLAGMGHDVAVATNGLDAWQMLQAEHIPLVLSDWMMPGLDGPSLCRRVRARGELPYTYFILLTARKERSDRMEGLRAGADDFLVKPVDAEELAVRLTIARRILSVQDRLERQNALLAELASTDELTGLDNRREFLRVLEANLALASRQAFPLSLILFDVDHFKSYNDEFGHPAGDVALRAVADAARSVCRAHEPAARYGGEEFAIIVFGSSEDAQSVAERMQAALAARAWPNRPLTASFGIATTGKLSQSASELMEQADRALYRSKSRGRNCISCFEPACEFDGV